ncbi:hypothetical protein AB0O67_36420 [Streptomyces sp. NPDC086077]|uniref:hypothetical protein n=1 Tax=Streptomyces sp. NPDC086077 TaxID=3154862 RepID=UPI003447C144
MPAEEVAHVAEADGPRVRTGPRHAAPKKPLFTRFHMPAGKAIALAAMPTAVLMGMGFTPKLALADEQPASQSLSADEYADQFKDCVEALDPEASADASATPSPSASASESESAEEAEPSPSAPSDADSSEGTGTSGQDSSSDSGSDDGAQPKPAPSSSAPAADKGNEAEPVVPSPSASESDKGVLETVGDAITGVVEGITGGGAQDSASPAPSPSATASGVPGAGVPSENSGDSGSSKNSGSSDGGKDASDSVEDAEGEVTDTVEDAVGGATDKATEQAEPTDEAGTTPSPSASSTVDPEDCPRATDAEGGVDNPIAVADDPWYLEASYLQLKGADYQGIVEVRTASGKTKKVLKYVISDGTKIGDLHQLVKDKQIGKTYHVQAEKDSESTITDGDTVMYTESISGNLFGLIPLTFSPESPPPLNIPLIYFTNVKVTQAAQFGGTLTIPGMHVFTTD